MHVCHTTYKETLTTVDHSVPEQRIHHLLFKLDNITLCILKQKELLHCCEKVRVAQSDLWGWGVKQ